ncbi:hypothetical protein ACIHFC_17710 [Streptomyces sp. NPDC052013]
MALLEHSAGERVAAAIAVPPVDLVGTEQPRPTATQPPAMAATPA